MSSGWRPVVGSSSRKTVCGAGPARVSAASRPGQEAGQLEALRLAAGERRGGLAEPQVVQPDVEQRPEPRLDLGAVPEEAERLARGQVEHLGDVPAAVGDLQDLRPIARAAALGAADHHVGQELHVDRQEAVPLTGVAAAPLDVEAELAGVVVPQLGLVGRGERLADLVERLQVRDRVRPGRPASGDWSRNTTSATSPVPISSVYGAAESGSLGDPLPERGVKRLLDQRALARAADAGHHAEDAERERHVDRLQVVAARTRQPDGPRRSRAAACRGRRLAFAR